ncbi:MAG: HigA family addiction module antitoxin [Spirochaetes bacterium]|jgi:addiction module HigA family antidote|nr:HigA family addiction module antitoxin [Spirochaetota bacterium]
MQKKQRPKTPGETLNEVFLKPLGITQEQLANRLGVTRVRLNEVLLGKRSITIDTAIRLARFFNTTVEFWIGMQVEVDMWDAMNLNQKEYEKIIPLKNTNNENK